MAMCGLQRGFLQHTFKKWCLSTPHESNDARKIRLLPPCSQAPQPLLHIAILLQRQAGRSPTSTTKYMHHMEIVPDLFSLHHLGSKSRPGNDPYVPHWPTAGLAGPIIQPRPALGILASTASTIFLNFTLQLLPLKASVVEWLGYWTRTCPTLPSSLLGEIQPNLPHKDAVRI